MTGQKNKSVPGADKVVRKDLLAMLSRIQLFSSFSEREMERIAAMMLIKQYRKNNIVFYEEETNEFMYMILQGKVKVVQITENGKEIVLALHRTGDFFGEMSLIDNRTTPAMVVSTEASIIAIIARDTFRSLLHTQGKMVDVMLRILCDRLRASWDRIQILSFSSASQRIRMLLHVLSDEHGQRVKNGIMLNVKLTHQDIANMTGIARETVTRVLDRLNKDGEVTVLKKRVFVLSERFTQRSLEC